MPPDTAQILDAVQAALAAEDQAKASVQMLLRSKVEAGRMLEIKRRSLEHGSWLPWLAEHLTISERTARNWIKLAQFADRYGAADIENAQTVRAAYVLAGLLPEPEPSDGQGKPAIEGWELHLHRAEKALLRVSVEALDDPQRQSLLERLRPFLELAARLASGTPR